MCHFGLEPVKCRLLEAELSVPVYDSVAITLWKSLSAAEADPGEVKGWGGAFQLA